jgi:hypothetical protein
MMACHGWLDATSSPAQPSTNWRCGKQMHLIPRQSTESWITNLPIFHQENVGCINWGLVAGKTNTIWQWGTEEGTPEPDLWFHDLFRQDGTPYREQEVALFKRLTSEQGGKE